MFQQFKKGQIVFHTKTKRQGKVVKQEGASTVVEFILSQDSEQGTRTTKVESILTHELRSSKPKRHSYAPYFDVMEFHKAFGHPVAKVPVAIKPERATQRADYLVEELIEFLWASVAGNEQQTNELVDNLIHSIHKAKNKCFKKGEFPQDEILLHQTDALNDINYINYGSIVETGVNPKNVFAIIHECNMKKLDPITGKPIIDPVTQKILKPEGFIPPEELISKEIKKQQELM